MCIHLAPRQNFIALTAILVLPILALGSSSGLNNIPTADTAPHHTLVLQEYPTFGVKRDPTNFAGFKFGVDPWQQRAWRHRFEFGVDGEVATENFGPAVVQAKYATQPRAYLPALSIGVANAASTVNDRQRAGQPFMYAVLSHDLKVLRVHGGYGLQAQHNNSAFLGIDRTLKLFGRDLMIRGDAIQTEHRQNWLASVGGLYAFCKYFVLESWWNQPAHRSPGSITIKFNLVIGL